MSENLGAAPAQFNGAGTGDRLQLPIKETRDPEVRRRKGPTSEPKLIRERTPPLPRIELEARAPSLSNRVIATLRKQFPLFGHFPSEEHWKGLTAIAKAIEDMAEGRAAPEYFYSSLATGMGKTSVLLESIGQMRKDPRYAEVGIVVFCSRLEQIEWMIAELGLARGEFAVETGQANTELNQRGCGYFNKKGNWVSKHQLAPILFTTQAKLLTISSMRVRNDFEGYWRFNDRPRQVRVWDEAVMPAKPLVVTPSEMRTLASQLDLLRQSRAAAELRGLALDLQDAALANKPTFMLPMLDEWVDYTPATQELYELDATLDILTRMSGQEVRLYRDPTASSGDGTTITYRELLPQNLAPMLILDASGDLKVTYKAWREGRGGLVRLPSADKRYQNLTINHWDNGAGKARYRDNADREELAAAAVKAFFSIPTSEKVLIVVRKPEKQYANLVEQIKRKVAAEGGNPDRIESIAWGWHTASNAFADIKHIIVLGLLQYRPADYEAHWRAAAGTPPKAEVGWQQVEELRQGEIAHHLFQAVGRGAVRKTINGDVPPGCTLWVVFSTLGNMAINRNVLATCFPGAKIKNWNPFGAQLRGNRLRTDNRVRFFDALLRRLGERDSVSFEVGDFEPSFGLQMARRYLNEPTFREALLERGITVEAEVIKRGRARPLAYTLRRLPQRAPTRPRRFDLSRASDIDAPGPKRQ